MSQFEYKEAITNHEILEYFMNNTVEGSLIRDVYESDQMDSHGFIIGLNNVELITTFISMYDTAKALNTLIPLMDLGYDVGNLIRNMYNDNTMVDKTRERTVIEFLVQHNKYNIYMLAEFIQSQRKIRYNYLSPSLMSSMIKCAIHIGASIDDLIFAAKLFCERYHNATARLFLQEKDRMLAEIYMIWHQYTCGSAMCDDQIYIREIQAYIYQS